MLSVVKKEYETSCTREQLQQYVPQPRVCSHVCHGIDAGCVDVFARTEGSIFHSRAMKIEDAAGNVLRMLKQNNRVVVRKPATHARGFDFSSLGVAVSKLSIDGKIVRLAAMDMTRPNRLPLAA